MWNEYAYQICLLSPAEWVQNHVLLFCWLRCSSNKTNLQDLPAGACQHSWCVVVLTHLWPCWHRHGEKTTAWILSEIVREQCLLHLLWPYLQVCALYICCTWIFYITVREVLACSVYPVTISFLWQWYSIYYSFFMVKLF